jgi:hypothetical protein
MPTHGEEDCYVYAYLAVVFLVVKEIANPVAITGAAM